MQSTDLSHRSSIQQLREAERFMTAVVESSDDAIITKDLDGIITSWNRSAEKLFGYSAREAIGKPIAMLIPEGRENEEPDILGRLRKGEIVDHYQTVRRRKDGSLIDISITVSPVKDSEGIIIGASKVARDISVQTKSDATLRYMAAIVESSDDAIITKDLTGKIISWNKSAEKLFGYLSHEAIGKHVAILIPSGREDEEPHILARIRRGEKIDHYETVRKHKDGSLIDISITVSPVKDARGKVIGASKVARDITSRKKIELELATAKEQLAKANSDLEKRVAERTASLQNAIEQMEEFSYSVSHDLRSPIRAMTGYAEATLEDFGGEFNPTVRENLNYIIRSGLRMQRLINDVLTYSRLARSETVLQAVAMEKLIPDIVRHYESMQPPNAEITIHQPLQPALAHEPSLTQAISNLLANGIKFVAPGTLPKLEVWTERINGHVRLWIRDNGIGIKPEHHRRLFGMFERIHQKDFEGTGIGLAIVRKAIDKMGGSVGVRSDGVNGSTFWIELPAIPQTP